MRERLISLIDQADEKCKHTKVCKNCSGYGKGSRCMNYHIADYILADGWLRPPVNVGQIVYIIDGGDECTEPYALGVIINSIGYDKSGFWITMALPLGLKQSAYICEKSFGKTVFLTREEAEAKLKEGGKG